MRKIEFMKGFRGILQCPFVFLSGAEKKPRSIKPEILHERHQPSDLEIPLTVIVLLGVEVPAVYTVCLTETRQTAGQLLFVQQFLNDIKVSFLYVERVLLVCSCSAHIEISL